MNLRKAPILLLAAVVLFPACAVTEFFEDVWQGIVRREGELVDGEQEGLWTYRYDSGQIHRRGRYEDDKQVGLWTIWYENGNKQQEGAYVDGYRGGLWTYWNEDGSRYAQGIYERGLEEGPWTYYNGRGELESRGEYHAGKQTLLWTYWYPGSGKKAEGYYLDGEKVGTWRYWTPSGSEAGGADYPLPAGSEPVREAWPNGELKRAGFLRGGQPVGRWVSWRENGTRRVGGELVDGSPEGLWVAGQSDGELLAAGSVRRGEPGGDWEVFGASSGPSLPVGPDPGGVEPVREPMAFVRSELQAIARPLAVEAAPPAEPAAARAPSPELAAETKKKREAPIQRQPWTVREEENMETYLAMYESGMGSTKASLGDLYTGGSSLATGGKGRPDLINRPLPLRQFMDVRSDLVDLDQFRGRKVIIVILRGSVGMGREVCVYCSTQAISLAEKASEIEQLGCEVALVYPGPAAGLDAFLDAYRSLDDEKKGLPYKLLQDVDSNLVKQLRLEADLAVPTTLILDENGIVRYVYEGKSIIDRPSAKDLIEEIKRMSTEG